MGEPPETDRFRNAATRTIVVTVTVAGGARPRTAHRRADTVADRIASAAEDAAARHHREADRRRRREVLCLNAWQGVGRERQACLCVYCEPARHLHTRTGSPTGWPLVPPRCICGRAVQAPGQRCPRHHDTDLIVLDDDPEVLRTALQASRDVR